MAIKEYIDPKNGMTLFQATTVVKSKIIPGLRIQKQLSGIESQSLAQRRLNELIKEAQRELITRESQGEMWSSLVERWGLALQTGVGLDRPVTPSTAHDYIAIVTNFTQHWWKRPAASISRMEIKLVMESVTKAGRSGATKKRLKTALSQLFQWGIETGQIRGLKDNPVIGIKLGTIVEREPKVLTPQEAKQLLIAARNLVHPWYPVWALALMTGMRSGELHALEWTDVDFEGKLIHVNKSYNGRMKKVKCPKNGTWRSVPISPEVEKFLKELKLKSDGSPHVLPRFGDWNSGNQAVVLRQFCEGLNITKIRFHDLRACFATFLLRDRVPAIQVMKICGWKDLKTMQRYVRIAAIDVNGATDGLKLLPDDQVMGRVIELIGRG